MARVKKDDPQAVKILRINGMLRKERLTLAQLAKRMVVSDRTVYRYFGYFESAGIEIEKDFDNRYFIAAENII